MFVENARADRRRREDASVQQPNTFLIALQLLPAIGPQRRRFVRTRSPGEGRTTDRVGRVHLDLVPPVRPVRKPGLREEIGSPVKFGNA